jgi:hypothetical protein
MKRTLFFGILVALLMTSGPNGQLTAQAPVMTVSALIGPAVLDDWGNRFTLLGASVPENALRANDEAQRLSLFLSKCGQVLLKLKPPDVPSLMQVINTRESADRPHRLASVACSDNVGPEYLLARSRLAPVELCEDVSRHFEVLNDSGRRRQRKLAVCKWSRDSKLDLQHS